LKIVKYFFLLVALSGFAQKKGGDSAMAVSSEACSCIAQIGTDSENKNIEIKNCILTTMQKAKGDEKLTGDESELAEYKKIEAELVQTCVALQELSFAENRKFKHSYSENVLAQLAYDDGMEFLKDGDLESAISKFSKAVEIDSNFAFAWDNLGISYRKNKEYDKAIAAYQRSLEIFPEGRLPLLNIAITSNMNRQYDQAIKYYEQFISIYRDDPEGYYGLGLIQYTQDQEEEGLDNLIHAYTIYTAQNSPYRADAAKKIGYMYKDLKNQDKLDLFHKVADRYNLKIQQN